MISHDSCREQLGEFLDQTLEIAQREKVEAHLESCTDCSQVARELAGVRATLREMAPVSAPEALRRNVRLALQNERKPLATRSAFRWRLPQLAWSGTLAAAALALIISTRSITPTLTPESASAPALSPSPAETASAPAQKVRPSLEKKPVRAGTARNGPSKTKSSTPLKKPRASSPKPERDAAAALPLEAAPSNTTAAVEIAPSPSIPRALAPSSPRNVQPVPVPPILARRPISAPAMAAKRQKAASNAPPPPIETAAAPSPALSSSSRDLATAAAPVKEARRAPVVRLDRAPETPLFALRITRLPDAPVSSVPAPAAAAEQESAAAPQSPPTAARSMARENDFAAGAATNAAPSEDALADAAKSRAAPAPRLEALESRRDLSRKLAAGDPIRLELRIQGAQRVENARVRLEVVPPLRLVFPASDIVWSGALSPQQPLSIPFSLGSVRGGETILVRVEQNAAGGPSRTLETQTLILPPPLPSN